MPFDRLRDAAAEPRNWLTYSGTYFSQRYSELDQVTPENVDDLQLQWVYQTAVAGPWQSTPLVVDGVMYLTQRPNDVVALDARTGRVFWIYRYNPSPNHRACCGSNNRGVAVLGDRLFMGDAGRPRRGHRRHDGRGALGTSRSRTWTWAYSFTLAPLAIEDKVIVGTAGGDRGRPRLHRGARRRDRRGGVALPHHPGTGRAGARDVGAVPRPTRRPTATRRPGCTAARPPG